MASLSDFARIWALPLEALSHPADSPVGKMPTAPSAGSSITWQGAAPRRLDQVQAVAPYKALEAGP